jgi:methyl-accepting chemotaxis protein
MVMLVLVSLCLVAAFGYTSAWLAVKALIIRQAEEAVSSGARQVEELYLQWTGGLLQRAEFWASRVARAGIGSPQARELLSAVPEKMRDIAHVTLYDREGRQVFDTEGRERPFQKLSAFREALSSGRAAFTPIVRDEADGELMTLAFAPLPDRSGVLVAGAEIGLVQKMLATVSLPPGGDAYFVSPEGLYATRSRHDEALRRAGRVSDSAAFRLQAPQGAENLLGRPVIRAEVALRETGERIRVEYPLDALNARVASAFRRILLLSLPGFVLALALALFLGRRLSRNLSRLTRAAERFGQGELGPMAESLSRAEEELSFLARVLARAEEEVVSARASLEEELRKRKEAAEEAQRASMESFSATLELEGASEQLRSVATRSREVAERLGRAILELERAAREVARGAEDQARAVQEGARDAQAVLDRVRDLSRAQEELGRAAEAALETVREGARLLRSLLEGMKVLGQEAEEARRNLSSFAEKLGGVSGLTETINEIASQTNLLALNAAIEAARAGEHGRGFAVVAEEVRRLADKTREAAEAIKGIVGEVTEGSEEVARAISQMTEKAVGSAREAEAGAQELQRIEAVLGGVGEHVRETAERFRETHRAVEELFRAFESIAGVTEEYTAAAEEMTAAHESMGRDARGMGEVAQEVERAAEAISAQASRVSGSMAAIAEKVSEL